MNKFDAIVAQDPDRKYVCDICQEIVFLKDVVLEGPTIPIIPLSGAENVFVWIDNCADVKVTSRPPTPDEGKYMTCPKCGAVHPFGFMKAAYLRMCKEAKGIH